jgi:hypothetical protein
VPAVTSCTQLKCGQGMLLGAAAILVSAVYAEESAWCSAPGAAAVATRPSCSRCMFQFSRTSNVQETEQCLAVRAKRAMARKHRRIQALKLAFCSSASKHTTRGYNAKADKTHIGLASRGLHQAACRARSCRHASTHDRTSVCVRD